MKVHASALKHGVVPEDAVQAADLALWIEPLEGEAWPHRELRLGEEMVIHAMPARRQYWDLLP